MGKANDSAKPDWRIAVAWLTLCVVWSSTWLAIKIGLRDLPPVSFVAIRFVIAAAALVIVSIGRVRLLPLRLSDYAILAFTGSLQAQTLKQIATIDLPGVIRQNSGRPASLL